MKNHEVLNSETESFWGFWKLNESFKKHWKAYKSASDKLQAFEICSMLKLDSQKLEKLKENGILIGWK